MIRGFPPSELASTTAIPGAIVSASPRERKGSARISDAGTALTATVDVRMLVAERLGVTTTVSSCGTVESRAARPTCAAAVDEENAIDNASTTAYRKPTIIARCASAVSPTTSQRQKSPG